MPIHTNAKKGLLFLSVILLVYQLGDGRPTNPEGQISLPYIPVTLDKPEVIGYLIWLLFFIYWWRFYLDGRAVWQNLKQSVQFSAARDSFFGKYIKREKGLIDTDHEVFWIESLHLHIDRFLSSWTINATIERRVPVHGRSSGVTLKGEAKQEYDCQFGWHYTFHKIWYLFQNALTARQFFDSALPHVIAIATLYVWHNYLLANWPREMIFVGIIAAVIIFSRGAQELTDFFGAFDEKG
ncbi:hypothetical protein [Microbulbifer sediminum]|uniref:hypothetical protein n=1 Tax=Microbulbifer sediminum TaxID=2904250 RepID=UPI001F40523D|nr:hypothetical protein [Microbulbifer sediminum]